MELIKLLGFKGFIIFSDLRLLGYKKSIFLGGGAGGQGGNICLLFDLGDLRELGNKNFK